MISSVLWSSFFTRIPPQKKVRNTLTENGVSLRGQVTIDYLVRVIGNPEFLPYFSSQLVGPYSIAERLYLSTLKDTRDNHIQGSHQLFTDQCIRHQVSLRLCKRDI